MGSVWLIGLMTICDMPEIREKSNEYKILKNYIVWAMIALGYPKNPGVLPEQRRSGGYYVGETKSEL
ncbi:hypothetical protein [Clostridium estertheticum]|uniref:hypothetical protein n=1 Tax=Clostridium estertheticum TaxID=238834 RepID=UPI001C0E0BCD|nr:hypothetical protein [Clostridium estertheticum]MBU3186306.1 hypothetical protein [Clostridium estertheticum]